MYCNTKSKTFFFFLCSRTIIVKPANIKYIIISIEFETISEIQHPANKHRTELVDNTDVQQEVFFFFFIKSIVFFFQSFFIVCYVKTVINQKKNRVKERVESKTV